MLCVESRAPARLHKAAMRWASAITRCRPPPTSPSRVLELPAMPGMLRNSGLSCRGTRHGLRPRRSGTRRSDAGRRAVRRPKRDDNKIDRARVLEVRIQYPPGESQRTLSSWTSQGFFVQLERPFLSSLIAGHLASFSPCRALVRSRSRIGGAGGGGRARLRRSTGPRRL